MGIATGSNDAGVDKEAATRALRYKHGRSHQLGQNGFTDVDDVWSCLLCGRDDAHLHAAL